MKDTKSIMRAIDEKSVVNFLLSDAKNRNSIFECLVLARENARTSREIIPSEIWEQVNALYYTVKENVNPRLGRANSLYSLRRNNGKFTTVLKDCLSVA